MGCQAFSMGGRNRTGTYRTEQHCCYNSTTSHHNPPFNLIFYRISYIHIFAVFLYFAICRFSAYLWFAAYHGFQHIMGCSISWVSAYQLIYQFILLPVHRIAAHAQEQPCTGFIILYPIDKRAVQNHIRLPVPFRYEYACFL